MWPETSALDTSANAQVASEENRPPSIGKIFSPCCVSARVMVDRGWRPPDFACSFEDVMAEVATGVASELGDCGVAVEPPTDVLACSLWGVSRKALKLEVILHSRKPAGLVDEAAMTWPSGPTASRVLVMAVAGAKSALGQLCAAFENMGALAEADCQVRACCTACGFLLW